MSDQFVPEDLILRFFREATTVLDALDYQTAITAVDNPLSSLDPKESHLTLADCRCAVLQKQKSVLSQVVQEYNDQNSLPINLEQAQEQLASDRTTASFKSPISRARTEMEEAARCAICRLVLISEARRIDESARELRKEGTMERSKLLEFMALCQSAVKLPIVQKHLAVGSPLGDDHQDMVTHDGTDDVDCKQPTAMNFPQARLERIQRYISRAVGWHPEFTTKELRRLFFMQLTTSEYANDSEIVNRFQQVILQMNAAVTTASLEASKKELSDFGEGGVTRVVSVQCSDVLLGKTGDDMPSPTVAPTRVTIDPHLCEEDQKRQIRMASEATRLQQDIVNELLSMSDEERNFQLEKARRVSEEFLQKTMTLPVGRERIEYLQSVDAETSRLLAMHKIWPTVRASDKKCKDK